MNETFTIDNPKPKPRFHWKCKHTWKKRKKTAWCLLGCSIGDFGTILYFQLTGIPWPSLYYDPSDYKWYYY